MFQVIERTFGLSPGFYWQTVETQECVCEGRETALETHTEVSMLSFKSPFCCSVFIFLRILFSFALAESEP